MNETFYDFIKNHSTEAKFNFPREIINVVTEEDCDKKTTKFIRDEYIRIGKASAWEFDDLNKEPISKTFHSLILYYFGIAVKNYFIKHFEKDINKLPNVDHCDDKDTYWFEYIWRLTSFYHDVMTKVERGGVNTSFTSETALDIKNYLQIYYGYNIKYTIFNEYNDIKRLTRNCLLSKNNTYPEKIVDKYFRKRLEDMKPDHGILSGYVFYNQLVKNYLEKDYQHLNNKKDDGSFQNGNLNYRPEHLILFKFIADAIIAHNIWHYKKGEKNKNIVLMAKELSNYNRLTILDNPLAFMLGLLDTIEPTKFFNDVKPHDVLTSIEIEWAIENNRNLIITLTNHDNSGKIDFDAWYKAKFEKMDCWLDLTTKYIQGSNEIIMAISVPKEKSLPVNELKPKRIFKNIDNQL